MLCNHCFPWSGSGIINDCLPKTPFQQVIFDSKGVTIIIRTGYAAAVSELHIFISTLAKELNQISSEMIYGRFSSFVWQNCKTEADALLVWYCGYSDRLLYRGLAGRCSTEATVW